MSQPSDRFQVRLAQSDGEINEVQRLRYRVFVDELKADGCDVDHVARVEVDRFDPHANHLLLLDLSRPVGSQVIGTYRLMDRDIAAKVGGFYTSHEYDLTNLLASNRNVLELGRSCIAADYRGGTALMHLWAGLVRYVDEHKFDTLFGVASFHGVDVTRHVSALNYLHENHSACQDIRPVSRVPVSMRGAPQDAETRKEALRELPPLIKAYLRLGGKVGEGAYIDHAFNTIDVCMTLDRADLAARSKLFMMVEAQNG